MKQMKHSQKIVLNKQTVSRLNAAEMKSLHGGEIALVSNGCFLPIFDPHPDPWKPEPLLWNPEIIIVITG